MTNHGANAPTEAAGAAGLSGRAFLSECLGTHIRVLGSKSCAGKEQLSLDPPL